MKRFMVVAVAALALAPAALAKEVLGLQLCGSSGCATDKHAAVMAGPAGPLSSDARSASPAKLGKWFRGELLMGDHGKVYGRMAFYFVPDGSLIVLPGHDGQTTAWESAGGRTKATLERLAARLEPFPTPTITRVSLNARNADDPQSYAQYLFASWQNNNRTDAANVASADAVTQMFAQAYPAKGPYTFSNCDPAAGSLYCTWNGQNGASIQMQVRTLTGGLPIQVQMVEFMG